MAVLVISS